MNNQVKKIFRIYTHINSGKLGLLNLSEYYIRDEFGGAFLSEESAIEAIKTASEINKFFDNPEFVIVPSYIFYGY